MNGFIIPIPEYKRMAVVLLKSHGIPHQKIAQMVGISGNTLRAYLREFQEGGIERLKKIRFHHPRSALQNHSTSLETHFREHPPATIKEARAVIEEFTGIRRSPTQIRTFLKTLGMQRRKVGSVPAQADSARQKQFQNEQLEPCLLQARTGKRKVFFVDASHFVFSLVLGFLWSFTRIFLPAPSGRQRFNVLGALNAVTHELITVTNTTYINALSVGELLAKIRRRHPRGLITVVLDNARYQRCKWVQEKAVSLKIELLFLPPYSPNLNLIERFWKLVKKNCLYSKFYPQFSEFQEAISHFINTVHVTHKKELRTLLSHKFQDFSKAQIMTV